MLKSVSYDTVYFGRGDLAVKCELFDGLSETEVRALTENPACRELCFEKGEVIFDSQHFSNSIGLILRVQPLSAASARTC